MDRSFIFFLTKQCPHLLNWTEYIKKVAPSHSGLNFINILNLKVLSHLNPKFPIPFAGCTRIKSLLTYLALPKVKESDVYSWFSFICNHIMLDFLDHKFQDQFDAIDLSDNEIVKLENMPYLNRLGTLLINNNRITRINPNIGGELSIML